MKQVLSIMYPSFTNGVKWWENLYPTIKCVNWVSTSVTVILRFIIFWTDFFLLLAEPRMVCIAVTGLQFLFIYILVLKYYAVHLPWDLKASLLMPSKGECIHVTFYTSWRVCPKFFKFIIEVFQGGVYSCHVLRFLENVFHM